MFLAEYDPIGTIVEVNIMRLADNVEMAISYTSEGLLPRGEPWGGG